MKNYPSHFYDPDERSQSRIFLIARMVAVYVLTVATVVWGTVHYKMALFSGDFNPRPTVWLLTIWFLYYLAPLVLAVIYGLLFRPFWSSFRNLWVTILVIQFLYSFGANMLRWDYLQKINYKTRWSKHDRLKIINFEAKYLDHNQDGFKDELALSSEFDLTKMRAGEYLLDAKIIPVSGRGQSGGESLILQGGETVNITAKSEKNIFPQEFKITLRNGLARPLAGDIHFQIRFLLSRIVSIDEYGTKLLRFTRWVPYLRVADWEGIDRDINGEWIVLDKLTQPEIFILRASPVGAARGK